MGVTSNNTCVLGQLERDTMYHYICEWEHSQAFWTTSVEFLMERCNNCAQVAVDQRLVLSGINETTKTDTGFDFILLHAKFFYI